MESLRQECEIGKGYTCHQLRCLRHDIIQLHDFLTHNNHFHARHQVKANA